jgi:hypothetical protein
MSLPLKICEQERRIPFHRVAVEISGKKFFGFLLRSTSEQKKERDTLYLPNLEIISLLPIETQRLWQAFSNQVDSLKKKWRFDSVSTLKRIVNRYRKKELFSTYPLVIVAHHHGEVPALIIDEVNGWKIALPNRILQLEAHRRSVDIQDQEKLEQLFSLDESLPTLFLAYYEQAAYYLQSVFFATDDEQALHFCFRVRTILRKSLRQKIDLIEHCPEHLPLSCTFAEKLREKYASALKEAQAVDSFAHLIINYIYGFFCIKHRAVDYHARLQELETSNGLFNDNSIALMKACGENMLNPEADSRFLDRLNAEPPGEEWLKIIAEISTFVAEIIRLTAKERLDLPRVFLTYHFNVKDSDHFFEITENKITDENWHASIIRGRDLGRNIRWSLLARIWISDYHLLFLPRSWERIGGGEKKLKDRENWVVLELLYGQLLNKELHLVMGSPVNEELLQNFRTHVEGYTTTKEIDQVTDNDWRAFINVAKERLHKRLLTHKYLECPMNAPADDFWKQFKEEVLDGAGKQLILNLFRGWCFFFEAEQWSIIQAILLLTNSADSAVDVKDIVAFIRSKQNDPRFRWAKQHDGDEDLLDGTKRHLKELKEFEFTLYEGSLAPLYFVSKKPSQKVELRVSSLHTFLSKKFGLAVDQLRFEKIVKMLLEARSD